MSLQIKKNHILAPYTTLKIGGPAEYFCEPASIEDLRAALSFAVANDLSAVWFGGGSNLLIHDKGVPGLVIRLSRHFSMITDEKDLITAEAGCWLPSLMKYGCDKGMLDLSCCAGIPGTVGGAVFMNAGTKSGAISDKLAWVEVLDPVTGKLSKLSKQDMDFGYRSSFLQRNSLIVTRAGFKKELGDKRVWWEKIKEQVRGRRQTQPKGVRSAGCFFRNPTGLSAGALIDRAGLKGVQVGDAMVSPVHANFLVNAGNATCEDFVELVRKVGTRVFDEYGIALELEVRLLGFNDGELDHF